jgi:hypothetical protein
MHTHHPSYFSNMTGVEYHVLHVQEPILYVIRKANRQAHDKGMYYFLAVISFIM